MLHIALHFILPLVVALVVWRRHWLNNYLWMLVAWGIDLDHLLADPIYDPERCSIGFHPLHSTYAVVLYLVVLASSWSWSWNRLSVVWQHRTQMVLLGIGLHLFLDALDCFF